MLPQATRLRAADGGRAIGRRTNSDLPEELLLKILGGLGSARDIIRTGVLYLSGVASGPRFRVGSSTASTGEVERTT
jgi:hypothetical protein